MVKVEKYCLVRLFLVELWLYTVHRTLNFFVGQVQQILQQVAVEP